MILRFALSGPSPAQLAAALPGVVLSVAKISPAVTIDLEVPSASDAPAVTAVLAALGWSLVL